MTEPRVEVQEYRVSLVPWNPDDDEFWLWDVRVARRGVSSWAVLAHGRQCLNRNGEWDFEPSPSNREDGWLERHRFDLETALQLARLEAGRITVNGILAQDHLNRRAAR